MYALFIRALGRAGFMAKAEDLLDEMHDRELVPSIDVYEYVLKKPINVLYNIITAIASKSHV